MSNELSRTCLTVVIPASGEALKVGTIRGVESRGMLCSGRELLLTDDADGIIELPPDAKIGQPVAIALGLTDPVAGPVVLELK